MLPSLILLAAAAALGAAAQRATGIGFSLVVAPACAIALAPDASIGTLVRLALVADIAVLVTERAAIDWRSVRHLLGPAALAVPVGAIVAALVPGSLMASAAAVATLGAAAVLIASSRRATDGPTSTSTSTSISTPGLASVGAGAPGFSARAAGFASGFMGVTTGMPGPPLALHASRTRGPLATERASMVVLFVLVDLTAALAHPHALPVGRLAVPAVAVLGGLAVGGRLVARVPERHLRTALLVMVTAGACAGLARVLS